MIHSSWCTYCCHAEQTCLEKLMGATPEERKVRMDKALGVPVVSVIAGLVYGVFYLGVLLTITFILLYYLAAGEPPFA
ncbi:hypothetical protein LCGC14_0657730 [marine sediment metagenome]|uniref:Uncharacterized protein n=1 Tax=marine sediment metagenome TaxID=412755 RepID=A0A0F9QZK1_9ZZZZ